MGSIVCGLEMEEAIIARFVMRHVYKLTCEVRKRAELYFEDIEQQSVAKLVITAYRTVILNIVFINKRQYLSYSCYNAF